jgi:hypothetical protein
VRMWGFFAHSLQYAQGPGNWVTTAIGHDAITAPSNLWRFLNPAGFFTSAQTWIGAAVGAALIAGAIQLRMRRAEI